MNHTARYNDMQAARSYIVTTRSSFVSSKGKIETLRDILIGHPLGGSMTKLCFDSRIRLSCISDKPLEGFEIYSAVGGSML